MNNNKTFLDLNLSGDEVSVKLEQLERLHSEGTPAAPWLPILIHIGFQVKTRQIQSYIFKEFAKTSNFLILKK